MITAGTKLGRHEVRSKIGEGGMGDVDLLTARTDLKSGVKPPRFK
jgi:hypothetical protein